MEEVNLTAVGVSGEEVKSPEGVNCGGDARSSDSPIKIEEDGSRPVEPEVCMPINAAGQLTIFYDGNVRVFNGIPPEKVNEIMRIAAAAAAATAEKMKNGNSCPVSVPVLTRCPSLLSTSAAVASPQAQLLSCKLQAELPITRRHSLQRFFEKRRDRLVSKSPYATTKTADDTKTRKDRETSPEVGKSSMLAGGVETNQATGLA